MNSMAWKSSSCRSSKSSGIANSLKATNWLVARKNGHNNQVSLSQTSTFLWKRDQSSLACEDWKRSCEETKLLQRKLHELQAKIVSSHRFQEIFHRWVWLLLKKQRKPRKRIWAHSHSICTKIYILMLHHKGSSRDHSTPKSRIPVLLLVCVIYQASIRKTVTCKAITIWVKSKWTFQEVLDQYRQKVNKLTHFQRALLSMHEIGQPKNLNM